MTVRSVMLLAAFMVAWPPAASMAQLVRHGTPPGDVRLSVFGAYALPFTRAEARTVTLPEGVVSGDFATAYSGGYGGGALVEIVAAGPVRAMTALSFLSHSRATVERSGNGDTIAAHAGSSFVSATAGFSIRIAESQPDLSNRDLFLSLHAGPAYVIEIPHYNGDGRKLRPLSSLGATAGIDAEIPVGRAATIQLGANDYVQFYDAAELGRRIDEQFAREGLSTSTVVRTGATHMWVLRAGIAFTFR